MKVSHYEQLLSGGICMDGCTIPVNSVFPAVLPHAEARYALEPSGV